MAGDGQLTLQLLGSGLIHPFARVSGVPGSRIVNATAPYLTVNGGASATLASDITLAAVQSGGGAALVGVGRQVLGTDPIRVNGGGSADLTGTLTVSILSFAGAGPGAVPGGSGNDPTKFLSGAGTWLSGTVAGVSSVSAVPAAAVNVSTGAVTISTIPATLTDPGHVPAVGVVDSTMFLMRSNPPTWGTPGITGFITLQGVTPGVTQTGHGHISGSWLSGRVGIGVSAADGFLHVAGDGTDTDAIIEEYSNSSSGGVITLGKARGTVGAPAATQTDDSLAGINVRNRTSAGTHAEGVAVRFVADGAVDASLPHQRFMDILNGSGVSFSLVRQSIEGIRFSKGHSSIPANSTRAKSTVEIMGSLGVAYQSKAANFTVDDETVLYLMDATAASCRATLPTAVGRAGRIVGFCNIGGIGGIPISTPRIIPDGVELINGVAEFWIPSYGDTVWLMSDNSNWWVVENGIKTYQVANRLDGAAVGASSTAEASVEVFTLFNVTSIGTVFGMRYYGTYSTNGTPNMTFRIREGGTGGTILQAMGTVAGASGVTDAHWELDVAFIVRTIAGGAVTVAQALAAQLSLGNASQVYSMIGGTLLAPSGSFSADGSLALALTHQFGTSHGSNNVQLRGSAGWVQPGTMFG